MTTMTVASGTRGTRLVAVAACCIIAGYGLTGCGGPNLLNTDGGGIPQSTLTDNNGGASQTPTRQTAQSRVAIAPVIGAPEAVATQLTAQLTTALGGRGVAVVPSGNPSDYTLRGYVVAARERVGTKVSYIWDVTDPQGNRVNRITGEEVIRGASASDPWASVSPAVVSQIVSKTSGQLGSWISQQSPARAPGAQQNGAPNVSQTRPSPVPRSQSVRQVAKRAAPDATGSIPRLLATQPRVTGAPGDGKSSLASALSRQLTSQGVQLTNGPNPRAYNVTGKVNVGSANGGTQPIQIDWVVTDASGGDVGTVTQKNKIPAGSLDGQWGQVADAAAAAAAQGILRLMKQNTATN